MRFFTLHMSLLVLSAFLTIIFVMAGIFMSKKKIWRGTFFFLTNCSIILLFTLNEKFLNRNHKAIVSPHKKESPVWRHWKTWKVYASSSLCGLSCATVALNTWSERGQRVVWYSLMVSICKYMVSRRFTTAVQLSAEIMQQRTYEVSWFGGCFAFTKIKKQPRL